MTANDQSQQAARSQGTPSQQPRRPHPPRRALLLAGGGLAVGAASVGAAWAATGPSASDGVPPDDDLMREHGVLKRVLLCYRAMTTQVQAGHPLAAAHVQDAALIIHDFIEGFHEGLEEGYVFPRVRPQLTSTVTTLLTQHARGRVITQYLLAQTAPAKTVPAKSGGAGGSLSPDTSAKVSGAMQAFVRMYEPHEAREDTVVFPAFRQVVPAQEFADLGQHFADLEHQQFGRDEFTAMVGRIAAIERALGIYELDQFTPQITPYLPSA